MSGVLKLSYSALTLWERDPDEFFRTRLAATRAAREPQGAAAAVGSAFDAYVKDAIVHDLVGTFAPDPDWPALDSALERSVEEHNRAKAYADGAYVLEAYRTSGAYGDLLYELETYAAERPRFEFTLERTVGGVPISGKPDVQWCDRQGRRYIYDWKVRGFYSASSTSPSKFYRRCRDGFHGKASRNNGNPHPGYWESACGVTAGHADGIAASSADYADQLSVYFWLTGGDVGGEFIGGIDELVSKPVPGARPQIRVAELRGPVPALVQRRLLERFQRCWDALQRNHVFLDLSIADSLEKQERLQRAALLSQGTPEDEWFAKQNRKQFWK